MKKLNKYNKIKLKINIIKLNKIKLKYTGRITSDHFSYYVKSDSGYNFSSVSSETCV